MTADDDERLPVLFSFSPSNSCSHPLSGRLTAVQSTHCLQACQSLGQRLWAVSLHASDSSLILNDRTFTSKAASASDGSPNTHAVWLEVGRSTIIFVVRARVHCDEPILDLDERAPPRLCGARSSVRTLATSLPSSHNPHAAQTQLIFASRPAVRSPHHANAGSSERCGDEGVRTALASAGPWRRHVRVFVNFSVASCDKTSLVRVSRGLSWSWACSFTRALGLACASTRVFLTSTESKPKESD